MMPVPAYESNALQVQLIWGDKNLQAIWLADESWTISDEFPTNTENLLEVRFSDDDGEIILGTFETNFRTESSASQSFSITASEFDYTWDNDGDSVSNLDESIMGRNPLVFDTIHNNELRAAFPERQTRSANTSDGYVITYGPDAIVPGQAEVQLQLNEHFVAELFDVHQHQRPNNNSDTRTLLHLHGYVLDAAHQIKFDHEYDVSTYALGFGSRMLWDSPTREFYWNFWEGEVFDSWLELDQGTQDLQTSMLEKFPDQFVSASATRFPSADARNVARAAF